MKGSIKTLFPAADSSHITRFDMQDNRRKANSPVKNIPFCPLFFCRDTHPLPLEMAACVRRDLYLHSLVPISTRNAYSRHVREHKHAQKNNKIVLFIFCEPGVCDLSKPRGNCAQPGICFFFFRNPSLLPPPSFFCDARITQPKSRPEMQLSCQSLPFTR
jgi:hypothetical protein